MPAVRNIKRHRRPDSNSPTLSDGAKCCSATLCEHPPKLEPIERDIVFKSSSSTPGLPSEHATSPEAPGGQTGSSTKKSHGRRRDEGYIARPRNCFIVFRSWYVKTHKDSSNQQNKLSEQAAKMWRTMGNDEKQHFMEIATQEQKAHKLAHPDYQYSPGPRRSPAASDSKPVKTKLKKANNAGRSRKQKDENDSDDWTGSASPPSYPIEDLPRAPRAAAVAAAQRLEQMKSPSPPVQESGSVSTPDLELCSTSSVHRKSASASPMSSPLLVPTDISLSDHFDASQEISSFTVIDDLPTDLRPGASLDEIYNEQLKSYPLTAFGPDLMYDYDSANPIPEAFSSNVNGPSDGQVDLLDEWLIFSSDD